MAQYSGNLLRLAAPQDPKIAPGSPDASHDQPSGPEGVPAYRQEQITVPANMGTEYAGVALVDGVPSAVVVSNSSIWWNAPEEASVPVGGGGTPNGYAPGWTSGDPHSAMVDTSARSNAGAGSLPANHDGNDVGPYSARLPMVGVAGTSFMERDVEFPEKTWVEPLGTGVDKLIGGTNSYAANNPEGDQYTYRGGGRVHYGFEGNYFVHQPMFIDKPAQFYEIQRAPITATDPLVGGSYTSSPSMGQLAANPWLSELGSTSTPTTYGVPVDGVV